LFFHWADRLTHSLEIPTFLIAGHETTSAALSWTLFGLSANLEAQRKLREELLTLNTDSPTMSDLKDLKYLDMVVREALRLWSPISSSKRVAVKDVLIPLRDGRVLKLNKGDEVRVPIHPMNTAKDVWGEDAAEFKYAIFTVSQARRSEADCSACLFLLAQTDGCLFPKPRWRHLVFGGTK